MTTKFSTKNDETFIKEVKKELHNAKKNISRSRQAFESLKSWVDTRAREISYTDESAFGRLKTTFDRAGPAKDMNDNDMEFSVETLFDYIDVISPDELKGAQHEINSNLSKNLRQLVGGKYLAENLNTSSEQSDWKPPTQHGLLNSEKIIKSKQKSSSSDVETRSNADAAAKLASLVQKPQHMALVFQVMLKETLKGNLMHKNETAASKVHKLPPVADNSDDNEDDDEDDDDDDYDDDEEESEEDVVARIASGMSANLMKALGMDTSHVDTTTTWRPPEKSGVTNSRPIVERGSKDEPRDDDDDDSVASSERDADSKEDYIPSGAMSANLMEALGLDTSHIDRSTDWKPPSKTGLNNSVPIVKRDSKRGSIGEEKLAGRQDSGSNGHTDSDPKRGSDLSNSRLKEDKQRFRR